MFVLSHIVFSLIKESYIICVCSDFNFVITSQLAQAAVQVTVQAFNGQEGTQQVYHSVSQIA